MSTIINYHSGVLAQAQVIGSLKNEAIEHASTLVVQSKEQRNFLDGVVRFEKEALLQATKDAAEAACELNHNMQIFLKHASESVVDTDNTGVMVFDHHRGGVS